MGGGRGGHGGRRVVVVRLGAEVLVLGAGVAPVAEVGGGGGCTRVRLGPTGVVRVGEHGEIIVGHAAQAIASLTLTTSDGRAAEAGGGTCGGGAPAANQRLPRGRGSSTPARTPTPQSLNDSRLDAHVTHATASFQLT